MSRRWILSAAVVLLAGGIPWALAQEEVGAERDAALEAIDRLADPEHAEGAIEQLVALGPDAVRHLLGEAAEGRDVASRGWAVVALVEIANGTPASYDEIRKGLTQLHENQRAPKLVRTWAAAGVVQLAKSAEELGQLATLVGQFPAVGRPIALRLSAVAGEPQERLELMLTLSIRHTELRPALTKAILAQGSGPLIQVLQRQDNQDLRRQAAAYLGTLGARGEPVASAIVEASAFDPQAAQVPWEGGALFLPALQPWPEDEAKALTQHLVAWFFWAHGKNRDDLKQQITNNLQSIGLGNVTQFWPGSPEQPLDWARNYAQAFGKAELEILLRAQALDQHPDFKRVLDSLQ